MEILIILLSEICGVAVIVVGGKQVLKLFLRNYILGFSYIQFYGYINACYSYWCYYTY